MIYDLKRSLDLRLFDIHLRWSCCIFIGTLFLVVFNVLIAPCRQGGDLFTHVLVAWDRKVKLGTRTMNNYKSANRKGLFEDFVGRLVVRSSQRKKIEKSQKRKKRKGTSWWFQTKPACTFHPSHRKNWRKKHRKEKKRYSFRGSLLVHPGHTPSLNDLKRLRQLVLDLLNNQK